MLLFISLAVSVLVLINIYLVYKLSLNKDGGDLSSKLDFIEKYIARFEDSLKNEFRQNREELSQNLHSSRQELNESFKNLGEANIKALSDLANLQKNLFELFSGNLQQFIKSNEGRFENLRKLTEEKLTSFQEKIDGTLKHNQKELSESLRSFEEQLKTSAKDSRSELSISLDKIRETIEKNLRDLQNENSKKLDEMRATVDEKLQTTLEKRLAESFKQVSERLEQVHKGLGEMQSLATGVGDLKKVLSNVKTRGILGEIQLSNILEQIMSPEQYDKNVATKQGSRDIVEFAIKLPGKDDLGNVVYLPVDSKFPLENYHSLLTAYDTGDSKEVESAAKLLEGTIKKCAKDIRDKYIDPPYTTDFGLMFLPIEGLYAEVVRRTNLIEELQREYKIIITGPTTLAALLNSLQMGFKTLAIEKRSSEVWKILGAVKTEFNKFGEVLKKAQEKINKASEDIDELVGARTKKIQVKLRDVQELSYNEHERLFPSNLKSNDDPEIISEE
jgi:DNA recombination protein RmuC